MTVKAVRPAKGLAEAGRALWRSIASQLSEDGLRPDAREMHLLTDACREADMLSRIDEALVGAPMMMRGAQGQQVANPLISEARRSRSTIAALLKQIGMDDPMVAGKSGSGSRTTSWQARAASNSRHRGA